MAVTAPPIVQIYPPISVSEAAAPPIRMMACKADLYSMIITKQLYTGKYTALVCSTIASNSQNGQLTWLVKQFKKQKMPVLNLVTFRDIILLRKKCSTFLVVGSRWKLSKEYEHCNSLNKKLGNLNKEDMTMYFVKKIASGAL